MLLNLSTLILAIFLFKEQNTLLWWASIYLGACLSVGLGLWFFDSEVTNYVGASGALYGILVIGVNHVIIHDKHNRWIYLILALYIYYKILSQNFLTFDRAYLQQYIQGNVIESSHLFGMIFGICVTAFQAIQQFVKPLEPKQ
jgi:membrane associated rhomboid family serine protease